ncbi:hypothetical protein GUJ93_ZPchr0008g12160 [Zizania palustris]|uniref:Uncharacterized protein n=1 Tax=Zizania palustris TaxID=103762 RepID=A0A8J5RTW1_ZIZPA|nr:hypothetical protein GUJ93_ZPchr0008g12160 [Zizania palustris]
MSPAPAVPPAPATRLVCAGPTYAFSRCLQSSLATGNAWKFSSSAGRWPIAVMTHDGISANASDIIGSSG